MESLPQYISHFRLGELLGKGGMGEVFRAWDEYLERWVAIKLCHRESSRCTKARARLRREAEATAHLSHPSIVESHGLIETEEGEALVLELVDGATLAQVLSEQGPLSPARLLSLAAEIASGLAAAHEHGILHRDLKTDNVMLTASGHAKILDWSAAKHWHRGTSVPQLTAAHDIVGTCRSMSPEQVCGLPLGPRSDLFSLGSLLYELASGISPFRGKGPQETWLRICTYRQTPLSEKVPGIPLAFSRLVDRLLEKDPTLRPKSAREVELALAEIDPDGTGVAEETASPAEAKWWQASVEPTAERRGWGTLRVPHWGFQPPLTAGSPAWAKTS